MRIVLAGYLTVAAVVYAHAPDPQRTAPSPPPASTQRSFVDRYCAACHSQRAKTAGLNSARLLTLDGLDLSHASEHPETAETVVRKLRAGMMPPSGAPRPDAATLESFLTSLENDL